MKTNRNRGRRRHRMHGRSPRLRPQNHSTYSGIVGRYCAPSKKPPCAESADRWYSRFGGGSWLARAALPLLTVIAAPATGEMTVNLGGRVHADAAFYDEDVTPLSSGTEFRRVRLFVDGVIDEQWGYKVQIDFADGEADLKDVYVQYDGFEIGSLKIGHFKVPFGLETLTSSKYITFMERALPFTFTPDRRIGVGLNRTDGNRTFAAAVYGDEANDSSNDEGVGIAGRFTIAPQLDDGTFLHFGVAALYEEPPNTDAGTDSIRLRERPESHVTSARLIDTGDIADVNGSTKFGLEAAAVLGPLSLQAEYIRDQVDAAVGNLDFDGYYAYASWFPAGDTREYRDGVFQRTTAENAWELALRYSHLSLDDGPVAGGEESNLTLGVNYYVNPYLHFMVNYTLVDVEGGINGDEDPSLIQFRAALEFK